MPTDRFVAKWELQREVHTPPAGLDLPAGDDAAAPLLNPLDDHGRPMVRPANGASKVRVQVPLDASVLRLQGADLPIAWRLAVRRTVTPLLGAGYSVSRFVRAHEGTLPYYLLSRQP